MGERPPTPKRTFPAQNNPVTEQLHKCEFRFVTHSQINLYLCLRENFADR